MTKQERGRRFSGSAVATALWAPLLGGVLATTVGASGCSDEFESCRENRTCTPRDDSAGAGGALESGVGGASTNGGGDASGDAGADAHDGLTIEAVSPTEDAVDIERDAVIEITFSADIDVGTVSSETIKVVGPDGAVRGTLGVDGSTVTFSPEQTWHLLAEYTIDVSEDVATADDVTLKQAHSFGFRTRDGVFTQPERLWSKAFTSVSAIGSRAGHVAVTWRDTLTPGNRLIALFNPVTRAWGEAQSVEDDVQSDYASGCVALNNAGQALAIVGSSATQLWNKANQGHWGIAKTAPLFPEGFCAMADDGTAMAIWRDEGQDTSFAASLSPSGSWSEPESVQSGARNWQLLPYGTGFIAMYETPTGAYSRVFEPGLGWRPAARVTEQDVNYVGFDSLGKTVLWTWLTYEDEQTTTHASLFDGISWSTEELGPVTEGTRASVGLNGHLASWNYEGSAFVARYDLDDGWSAPAKLGATIGDYLAPAATVDAAGNGLVAWPFGSSVHWRRSAHGSNDWSALAEIEDQDPQGVHSTVDASGNVTVVWSNALGVWASRFE